MEIIKKSKQPTKVFYKRYTWNFKNPSVEYFTNLKEVYKDITYNSISTYEPLTVYKVSYFKEDEKFEMDLITNIKDTLWNSFESYYPNLESFEEIFKEEINNKNEDILNIIKDIKEKNLEDEPFFYYEENWEYISVQDFFEEDSDLFSTHFATIGIEADIEFEELLDVIKNKLED